MTVHQRYGEDEEVVVLAVSSNDRSSFWSKQMDRLNRKSSFCMVLLCLVGVTFISSLQSLRSISCRESLGFIIFKGAMRSSNLTYFNINHRGVFKPDHVAENQIENFRNGNALMINVHVTHHGGTTFCNTFGQNLHAPSFACLHHRPQEVISDDYPKGRPWSKEGTAKCIGIITQYFRFISWEFAAPPHPALPQIKDTDWENSNLVSVYITRDPISRLLAGDAYVKKNYPNLKNASSATLKEWMNFARDDRHANNYALRILAGTKCCNGSNTDPIHLASAKELVSQFTYVLDIECLNAGMQAMADQLGINITIPKLLKTAKPRQHKPARDRIPHAEVYDYLQKKNRLDMEFYEWSKTIALVDCSALAVGE